MDLHILIFAEQLFLYIKICNILNAYRNEVSARLIADKALYSIRRSVERVSSLFFSSTVHLPILEITYHREQELLLTNSYTIREISKKKLSFSF